MTGRDVTPDGMTRAEVDALIASPEQAGRHPHLVTVTPAGDYEVEWNGETFTAPGPFALDSMLAEAGAPMPRDLYMLREGENAERTPA